MAFLATRLRGCLPALLLGLIFPAALSAQPIDAPKIDAIVKEALQAWQVPGAAVAIVRDGRVVYLKGFGVKELGRNDPVTADTLFPLGSLTKGFTTTAMAMLVDEGKMNWDDPVRRHLDSFRLSDPLADANVTLRDLVSHRTGVGPNDLIWYRSPWSLEEQVRRIGHVKLRRPFRSAFQYQTTMVAAAGLAVSRAAQRSWEEVVQKRIFDPLGMTESNFTTTAALKAPDHASPHQWNRQGGEEVIPWYPMAAPDPAGSINSSARDLSQWVKFQLGDGTLEGKRLVSAKNLDETHQPQTIIPLEGNTRDQNPETTQMSYGMAWVIQDYHGYLEISHGGAIDGFRAHLTLVPQARLGIVLLNNLDHTNMNLAVSNSILDLVLDLPRRDWNTYLIEQFKKQAQAAQTRVREREAKRQPGTKPSHELPAYTGSYEDPAYGKSTVILEKGKLVWQWYSFTFPLEHYQYDSFTAFSDRFGPIRIQFTQDADGEVAAMKVLDVMETEFHKVPQGG